MIEKGFDLTAATVRNLALFVSKEINSTNRLPLCLLSLRIYLVRLALR